MSPAWHYHSAVAILIQDLEFWDHSDLWLQQPRILWSTIICTIYLIQKVFPNIFVRLLLLRLDFTMVIRSGRSVLIPPPGPL